MIDALNAAYVAARELRRTATEENRVERSQYIVALKAAIDAACDRQRFAERDLRENELSRQVREGTYCHR